MTLNITSKMAITLGVLLSTMTTAGFAANPLLGNPFITNSAVYSQTDNGDHGHPGDQDDDDQDQAQDCRPDDDDKGDGGKDDDDNGHHGRNGGHHNGGYDGGKGDQDDQDKPGDQDDDDKGDQDQDNGGYCSAQTMRVDCRYRGEGSEPKFCYASAIYTPVKNGIITTYKNAVLGVGCDQQTIYNNSAWIHTETISERIAPPTAAFPGVEIFPQGALAKTGTYESVLDIRAGRLQGVCYVHPIE